MPSLAGGWLTLGTYARHQDYPQERFFRYRARLAPRRPHGFQIVNTMAGGRAGVKPPDDDDWRRRRVFPAHTRPGRQHGPSRRSKRCSTTRRRQDLTSTRNFLRPNPFFEYDYRQPQERPQGRLVPARGQPLCRRHRRVHVQPRGCRSPSVREHPGRAPRARGAAVCIDIRPCVGSARAVLPDADASEDTTRCAASATTAFADRTPFSRRPNTALKSGRASTRRFSTMQARSRCDAATSTSRISSTTTASASDSTPTTARSCASTPGSAAATASISTSCSAMSSKRLSHRRLSAVAARTVAVHGPALVAVARPSTRTIRSRSTTTCRSTRRKSCRSKIRMGTTSS